MTNKKKKRKRRRYKLVWPSQNTYYQKKKAEEIRNHPPGKKKRKRTVRWQAWALLAGVIVLLTALSIPRMVQSSRLRNIGYNRTQIKEIRERKLAKTIIDNNWYSTYLAQSLDDGTLNQDYLELYTVRSADNPLEANDFLLARRLMDKGYTQKQVDSLFRDLKFWEITPLLVYDYQSIESNYIDDVLSHEEENSEDHFVVSGNYYTPYADPKEVTPHTDMLVNKTWQLSESYVPANLTELSVQYAAADQYLSQTAAEALGKWCDAGREAGHVIYAASAYRDYDSQQTLYNNYVQGMGQEAADAASARPGFSEHQTGLTVDIACNSEDSSLEFKDTQAFQWAKEHCSEYGWILRYPEGKESITQYEFESWHYRYVGVELAKAVTASHLTFDEYWSLYLKPWDDESLKPSADILKAVSYKGKSSDESAASASPESTSSPQLNTTADPEALKKAEEAIQSTPASDAN